MRNFSRSLLLVGSIALMGGLAACGDDVTVSPPTQPTPKVNSVTVAPSPAQVRVGNTLQLTASVTADSGATPTVAWKTSDATIATVDASGKVTGVKVGQVAITATATANGSSASGSATVNVTNTSNVASIVLNPTAATITVGNKQAINATVTLDPSSTSTDKGVTWSSSNEAVATVDATGTVTAVSAGSATITATAKADPNATATATITVRPPVPTSISVQSITQTGNLGQTVNVNNVQGSIDVTLNVDPGENTVSRVEVLLDNKVVCSQQFSAQQNQALAAAAVNAAAAPVPVVCQINTAQFDAAGLVSFFNGQHVLSARAITSTGDQVATPSTNLVFNNASGFAVAVTSVNANGAKTAVDPRTGLGWTGGDVTVSLVPVSFAQGTSIATVNLANLFGKTSIAQLTPAANGAFSVTFDAATVWDNANTGIGNYNTPCPAVNNCSEPLAVAASTVTGGAVGPITILNLTDAALGNPLAFPALTGFRVDNTAPNTTSANGITPPAAFAPTANPIWVNASTSFAAGNLGLPASSVLSNSDAGVDNVVAKFYYGASGTFTGAPGSCDVTGLTAVAAGSEIPATIVSTTYALRVVLTDALGNQFCYDPPNTFGADFTAPGFTLNSGLANGAFVGQGGTLTPFSLTLSDNASGFGATPVLVSMTRVNANGTTTCVVGTGASCAAVAQASTTVDPTAGTGVEGYYTTTITIVDQAGNTTPVLTRTYLYDVTNPQFNGGIATAANYQGNAPATFTATSTDNLDVGSIFGVVTYPTAAIQYPTQQLGTFGTPLEKSTAISYTIPQFIKCLNLPNDFAPQNNKAGLFTFNQFDQAANSSTLSTVPGVLAAAVATCTTIGDVAVNQFFQNAPNYGTGKTSVSKSGTASTTVASSVTLTAIADVPLNTSNNPFPVVNFYYVDQTTGNLRLIGPASAQLQQNPTNRTWTYTISFTPPSTVSTAIPLGVVAVGIDSNGQGVLSNTLASITLTVSP